MATTETAASLYDTGLSPARQRINLGIALAGLLLSAVLGFLVQPPTMWGLLPIVLNAVLCLLGMDILIATVAAVASAALLAQPAPVDLGKLLGASMGDPITVIGMVIVLGAGLGEVVRRTGVAELVVRGILNVTGRHNQTAVLAGVLASSAILVAGTGTLAGSIAIAAPIVVPVCARVGFTRSATAAMLFVGGCAGLALAPFAGSNIAILTAAEVGYAHYLAVGAGPLAALSIAMAFVVIPWIQRRSAKTGDFYADEESGNQDETLIQYRTPVAALVFFVLLVVSVVYAAIAQGGTEFPLLALPILAIATGMAGGMRLEQVFNAVYQGAARLISMLLLFWLLAALFQAQDLLKPYDVILARFGDELSTLDGVAFALAIAFIGWIGVPGATAAQVTLIDKVFGPIATAVGVSTSAWVIVLLWASKGDTYGPFPNANMVGPMGFARSPSLRNQLLTGWIIMLAASVMYVLLLTLVV
ncbi:transporter permease [Flindersiella endophytica]